MGICLKCSQALDQAATQSSEYGAAKFCPLCTQIRVEEYGSSMTRQGEEELPPVEQFPNQMLDAVTTRLRAKSLDVQTLLNYVLGIFDKGDTPLPSAGALRPTAKSE